MLRAAVAGIGLGALGGAAYGADRMLSGGSPAARTAARPTRLAHRPLRSTEVSDRTLPSGVVVRSAAWVEEENARNGTSAWFLGAPTHLLGFADRTSATEGDTVTLYVDSPSAPFHMEAYRMGWYGGRGGRLVWRSATVAPTPQPPHQLVPGSNMVQCPWTPSLTVAVTNQWPPGLYLLKLVAPGAQGYVPLCVRDDASTAAYVVMSAVTTWQAYNTYGGYSLYTSPSGAAGRSRAVSFDRPYVHPYVENDFFGNELPLVLLAERYGLDVTYITSIDLHQRVQDLAHHRCLFSLGHDEYWSSTMRFGTQQAVTGGLNVGFLGANACYRHIRLQPSPLGPDRQQVCYKDRFMTEDPMWGKDPAAVTANWPDGPDPRPEQALVGQQYSDVAGNADVVVADPSAWLWQGTGVHAGQHLPKALQGEYDHYEPGLSPPTNVQIVAHSPVLNRGPGRVSDMTYYTESGGGGVFASGNAAFVAELSDAPLIQAAQPAPVAGVTPVFLRMMDNILSVFGAGPASATHPSVPNWQQFYS
ncbi:MAG: hypothetical protein M0007_01225 [Actinomycetota bacterium]|nr:hypothetical protein [Actinomycetota bacterium]